MSKKKINIAVVGATGYTGLDLVYMLSKHPNVNILNLCATKKLGRSISFFDNRIKKKLPKVSSVKRIIWNKLDLVFFSLPNGKAQELIKKTFHKYKKAKPPQHDAKCIPRFSSSQRSGEVCTAALARLLIAPCKRQNRLYNVLEGPRSLDSHVFPCCEQLKATLAKLASSHLSFITHRL